MEDNFNKHLGSKLKIRRLALGLTQTKVAKAIKGKAVGPLFKLPELDSWNGVNL